MLVELSVQELKVLQRELVYLDVMEGLEEDSQLLLDKLDLLLAE